MRVAVCLPDPSGVRLAEDLEAHGAVVRRIGPASLGDLSGIVGADLLVLPADPRLLTAGLVSACDRAAVRIVPLAHDEKGERLADGFGLLPATEVSAVAVLAAAATVPDALAVSDGGVIAVWGPPGSPGRSTVAASLALELSRSARTCLVDADTHAPSLAMLLGLSDDGPGVAGACRQASRSLLDAAEYDRIREVLVGTDGSLDVLLGINRPSRWPEVRGDRLTGVLDAARSRTSHVVVDVAAALERDEALLSDLPDAPRRNAASIASLERADRILAVVAPDAVGLARFVRAHAELRQLVPHTPLTVVVNRIRPSAAGVDPRGQVRRTLERFAGEQDLVFLPDDGATADRAVLQGTPVAALAPRSALAVGIRRLAARLSGRPHAHDGPRRRHARRRSAKP